MWTLYIFKIALYVDYVGSRLENPPYGLEFDHIVPVELFNNSDHQWDKSLSNYQEVKD